MGRAYPTILLYLVLFLYFFSRYFGSRFRVRARAVGFLVGLEAGGMDDDEGTSAVNVVEEVEHLVRELTVVGARLHHVGRRRRAVGVTQKTRRSDFTVIDRT